MKNPIIVGAIAGVVKGITAFSGWYPAGFLGLMEIPPLPEILTFLGTLGFDVIWGIFLAIIYSILYNSIPGKGISKGLVYGIGLYLVSNFRAANLLWSFGNTPDAIFFAYFGIFALIPYGLVLGALYKK